MMNELSRRELLKWTAAAAAARALPEAPQARPRIPLALQLGSVRDFLVKDFDATLQKVALMGFEGVEFGGYYKYKDDAKELRKKLDASGLKAEGTHLSASSFLGDAFKSTVEFHQTLGCRFLIIPGDSRFVHPEKSKEYADFMNRMAKALKREELFIGHHNHTMEFAKAEGDKTYWDLFAERTSEDVILQRDIGHSMFAGVDPIAIVRKSPGRIKTTHIKCRPPKDSGKKPFVGEDCFDWKGYVTACCEAGGTEWFTLEQEEFPDGKSSMECTRISLEGFKKVLRGS